MICSKPNIYKTSALQYLKNTEKHSMYILRNIRLTLIGMSDIVGKSGVVGRSEGVGMSG